MPRGRTGSSRLPPPTGPDRSGAGATRHEHGQTPQVSERHAVEALPDGEGARSASRPSRTASSLAACRAGRSARARPPRACSPASARGPCGRLRTAPTTGPRARAGPSVRRPWCRACPCRQAEQCTAPRRWRRVVLPRRRRARSTGAPVRRLAVREGVGLRHGFSTITQRPDHAVRALTGLVDWCGASLRVGPAGSATIER